MAVDVPVGYNACPLTTPQAECPLDDEWRESQQHRTHCTCWHESMNGEEEPCCWCGETRKESQA